MKKTAFRHALLSLIPSIALAVLALSVSSCFLRNIGSLILLLGPKVGLYNSEIAQFAAIFEQLRTASLEMPYFLTSICSLIMGRIGCRIICGPIDTETKSGHKGFRIAMTILMWIIVALLLFAFTLWFTKVNGIRVGIVIQILIPAVQAGIF